jgi:integrase
MVVEAHPRARRDRSEVAPYDLRHWSATHAIAGGHDVRSVAARLGHSDPTTTMRSYAHALEGLDQGIADTVAGVLDGEVGDG